MNAPNGFSKEQQAYLQGLMLGTDVARKIHSLPVLSGSASGQNAASANSAGATAAAGAATAAGVLGSAATASSVSRLTTLQALAQQRTEASGKVLVAEERAKRDKDALEMWSEIGQRASRGEFPKGMDVFLTKYHGLFYVTPAQNAFMCRLRIPGGVLRSEQMSRLAQLADDFAGGFADITTRANLQLREIKAAHALDVLMGLRDIGVVTLGSGADNIRNVTCSPLSGIDDSELIETLPLARQLHYHILHRRELYGLPRKFNIAFEGAGRISSLAETNDISWQAVEVEPTRASSDVSAGVYFVLGLGGITGHGDFARPTQVLVAPHDCIAVSEAILRVFILHGDRSDRKRARLKYLLDEWGFDKFLQAVEQELGRPLQRVNADDISAPERIDRWAHVGVHSQKQIGMSYIGVVVPAARLSSQQMRGLAHIASRFGTGQLRLTVWQNLLIPNIATENIPAAQAALLDLQLDWQASNFHAGLVACTGNAGCKFAASNTKRHSLELAEHLKQRFQLDQPINIHLTGCHHSCAQHAIGDIGLLATKVTVGEEMVEGYHILVGGRTGQAARIGQLLFESVAFEDVPERVEAIVAHYLQHRDANESFADFATNCDWQPLQSAISCAMGVAQ